MKTLIKYKKIDTGEIFEEERECKIVNGIAEIPMHNKNDSDIQLLEVTFKK